MQEEHLLENFSHFFKTLFSELSLLSGYSLSVAIFLLKDGYKNLYLAFILSALTYIIFTLIESALYKFSKANNWFLGVVSLILLSGFVLNLSPLIAVAIFMGIFNSIKITNITYDYKKTISLALIVAPILGAIILIFFEFSFTIKYVFLYSGFVMLLAFLFGLFSSSEFEKFPEKTKFSKIQTKKSSIFFISIIILLVLIAAYSGLLEFSIYKNFILYFKKNFNTSIIASVILSLFAIISALSFCISLWIYRINLQDTFLTFIIYLCALILSSGLLMFLIDNIVISVNIFVIYKIFNIVFLPLALLVILKYLSLSYSISILKRIIKLLPAMSFLLTGIIIYVLKCELGICFLTFSTLCVLVAILSYYNFLKELLRYLNIKEYTYEYLKFIYRHVLNTFIIPHILTLLNSNSANIRRLAAVICGKLHIKSSVPKLLTKVKDEDYTVRLAALISLWEIEKKEVLPLLIEMLTHETDEKFRATLVSLLSNVTKEEAMPHLLFHLSDPDSRVRANTIEAITQIGAWEYLSELKVYLNDKNNRVKANTIIALYKLADEDEKLEALKLLDNMLHSHNPLDRASAVYVLRNILGKKAGKKIISLIKEEKNKRVLNQIAVSLIKLEIRSLIPNLFLALSYEESLEKLNIFAKVFKHYYSETKKLLAKVLSTGTLSQRCIAIKLLSLVYPENELVDILLQFVDDDEPEVRNCAIIGLSKYSSDKILKVLIKRLTLEKDDRVIATILHQISVFESCFEYLLKYARTGSNDRVVANAIEGIYVIIDKLNSRQKYEAEKVALTLLVHRSSRVRANVANLLIKLKNPIGEEKILEMLNSGDKPTILSGIFAAGRARLPIFIVKLLDILETSSDTYIKTNALVQVLKIIESNTEYLDTKEIARKLDPLNLKFLKCYIFSSEPLKESFRKIVAAKSNLKLEILKNELEKQLKSSSEIIRVCAKCSIIEIKEMIKPILTHKLHNFRRDALMALIRLNVRKLEENIHEEFLKKEFNYLFRLKLLELTLKSDVEISDKFKKTLMEIEANIKDAILTILKSFYLTKKRQLFLKAIQSYETSENTEKLIPLLKREKSEYLSKYLLRFLTLEPVDLNFILTALSYNEENLPILNLKIFKDFILKDEEIGKISIEAMTSIVRQHFVKPLIAFSKNTSTNLASHIKLSLIDIYREFERIVKNES